MSAPLHELAGRYVTWGCAGDAAGVRMVDTLAVLSRGAETEEGRALAALSREEVGGQPADRGVLGTVCRRVAIVRMTELDDIHMPSCTTPGSVVVPVAVTLGAALGVSAERCRRAVEIGYDAMVRLGLAIDGARVVYRGIWPTYFCAPFAAAATAASLLELDTVRTANALGLALTRATGLTSGVAGAPLGRWLSVGDGARAGCLAAIAARRAFVADVDLDRIATAAGVEIDSERILMTELVATETVSIKPFPIAKQCLSAALAALRLSEEVVPDELGAVRVRVDVPPAYAAMVSRPPDPASRLSRLSSAPWNVALALARRGGLDDIERAVIADDGQLQDLAGRVEVRPDEVLQSEYPQRWPARVVLSTHVGSDAGGRELAELVVDAIGDPPANGEESVRSKWARLGGSLAGLDSQSPRELDAALPVR